MLERCDTLMECERQLEQALQGTEDALLGDLPVTEADLQRLNSLVTQTFLQHRQNPVWLARRTPVSLAVFLVWQGVRGYRDGDFWSSVFERVDIEDRKIALQWGEAFRALLSVRKLKSCDDSAGHRYVMPILLHGGIPTSCLGECFREVIWKLFVGRRIVAPEEVEQELRHLRQQYARLRQLELEHQVDDLSEEEHRLKRLHLQLKACREEAERLKEVRRQSVDVKEALENEERLEELESEKQRVLEELAAIDEQLLEAARIPRNLTQRIAATRDQLAGLEQRLDEAGEVLFDFGWDEAFGQVMQQIDSSELQIALSTLQSTEKRLAARRRNGVWLIASAAGFVGLVLAFVSKSALGMTAVGLALAALTTAKFQAVALGRQVVQQKAQIQAQFPANLKEALWADGGGMLDVLTEQICSLLSTREATRRELAELTNMAGEEQRRQVAEARKKSLVWQLEQLGAELAEHEGRRAQLSLRVSGLRDESGALSASSAADLRNRSLSLQAEESALTKSLTEKLASTLPRLDFAPEPSALEQAERRLEERLAAVRRRQSELSVAMETAPLAWLERPISRFILHGGSQADRFVTLTAELLNVTCRTGVPTLPPSWPQDLYRYQVIWTAFGEWWRVEGEHLCLAEERRATSRPRLRLVCWQEAGEWRLGAQVPDAIAGRADLTVLQNGEPLPEASRYQDCWTLLDLDDPVEVHWAEGSLTLSLQDYRYLGEPCYLFGGWGDDSTPLTAAKKPSLGKLLAVVPDSWSWDESQNGSPACRPEPVADGGLQAHFVELAPRNPVVFFGKADGSPFALRLPGRLFELVGDQLPLVQEHEFGPLFNAAPPQLRTRDGKTLGYHRAVTLSVYPVLTGRGRRPQWAVPSVEIGANRDCVSFPVPAETGCYAVVVYDANQDEVERLPFRYARGLNSIQLEPDALPFAPPPAGHPEVKVRLTLAAGYSLHPRLPEVGKEVHQERIEDTVVLRFPPRLSLDVTEWEIRAPGGNLVPIRLSFPRIWWALTEGKDRETEVFSDRVLESDPSWFRAGSQRVLKVRWNSPGLLTEVMAGFDVAHRRSYFIRPRTSDAIIPLSHFACMAEQTAQAFKLWFLSDRQEFAACTVAVRQAPADPEQRASCATCDFTMVRGKGAAGCYCCCVRKEWNWLKKAEFDRFRATYVCAKWQGEYLDPAGQWHESEREERRAN